MPHLNRIFVFVIPLAIALIALAARTINLENWPRWFTDEGRYGLTSFYLLRGVWGNEPIAPNFFPPLTPPLAALSILAFGQSYLAIRLPSALAGTVSCILLYVIGRRLYGTRVGAVAGLLMAISYAAVYMDRMAMKDAIMGMLIIAAVGCVLEARQGGRRWAIAAGILGGLAFLAKYPGVIAIAFAALELSRARRPSQLGYVLLAFIPLALVYPAMGVVLGWENFAADMLTQAAIFGYEEQLSATLKVLLLPNPVDQLRWSSQFSISLWGTLGFVLLFYLAARTQENDSTLLLWALSGIAALIFATPDYWIHVLPLLPVYYLAMAIALNDLLDRWRGAGLYFWGLGLLLLLLGLSEFALRRVVPEGLSNYGRYLFLAGVTLMGVELAAQAVLPVGHGLAVLVTRASRGAVLALVLGVILVAGASIFVTTTRDETADQRATVRFLKDQLRPGDLVAAAGPIIYPLGDQGFEYTFPAYVTFGGPMLATYQVQLPRLSRDMSLRSFRFVVTDTPLLAIPGRQAGPALAERMAKEWLLRFRAGDYRVYENPLPR